MPLCSLDRVTQPFRRTGRARAVLYVLVVYQQRGDYYETGVSIHMDAVGNLTTLFWWLLNVYKMGEQLCPGNINISYTNISSKV